MTIPPSSIAVEQAAEVDADPVVALLADAARFLSSHPMPTWRPEALAATVPLAIDLGEVFVARDADGLVATVTIQWTDESFWGAQPPTAGYVHKLAVARRAAGQGLGRHLLAWAERHIAAAGRSLARLDCLRDNPTINALYVAVGYRLVGSTRVGLDDVHLYEKSLAARGQRGALSPDTRTVLYPTHMDDRGEATSRPTPTSFANVAQAVELPKLDKSAIGFPPFSSVFLRDAEQLERSAR